MKIALYKGTYGSTMILAHSDFMDKEFQRLSEVADVEFRMLPPPSQQEALEQLNAEERQFALDSERRTAEFNARRAKLLRGES